VPQSFVDSFSQNSTANFNTKYPAYFVKIGWDTTTITQQAIGLMFLLPVNDDGVSIFSPSVISTNRCWLMLYLAQQLLLTISQAATTEAVISWFVLSLICGVNDGEIGEMVMEDKMNLSIKTLARGEVTVTEEKKQAEKKAERGGA
jgi:hypothetical protein